ncbi:MAG TPA: PilN domain-containing protein [Gammaproteobacteria bacterium]
MSVPLKLVPFPSADWPRRIRSSLRRGFDWWMGQLVLLFPAPLRNRMVQHRNMLVLYLHEDCVEAVLTAVTGTRTLGRFGADMQQGMPAELRRCLQQELSDQVRVNVRLPREQLLQCTLKLPVATLENLRQVLGYEMDLHTPFTAEQVCFDYRVTAVGRQQIEVQLYVAPRALIDQAVRLAQRLGLRLHAVDIADGQAADTTHAPVGDVNLLPADQRPRRHSRRQLVDLALCLLMLLLIAANLVTPFWRQEQRLAALEQALDGARKDAAAAFSLRDQRNALITSLQRLRETSRAAPPMLEILDELSGRIPDGTWLQHLEIKGASLQIQGESTGAAALIGLLEDSPLLDSVSFRAPVTQDPRSGKESFQIAARLTAENSP